MFFNGTFKYWFRHSIISRILGDIGADFAGATGASAPAQFLQRGLSPLTYDAAKDGRGGREGKGGEGHSAPAHLKVSRRLCWATISRKYYQPKFS
jgi:hypothetical protein